MRYVAVLGAALLAGCASVQDTYKQTITVAATYDKTWQSSVAALSEIGFTVKNSDKNGGLLYAEGGRNLWTQNKPPQLNILLNEGPSEGQTTVQISAVQPGQVYDWGSGEGNAGDFKAALLERVKLAK